MYKFTSIIHTKFGSPCSVLESKFLKRCSKCGN